MWMLFHVQKNIFRFRICNVDIEMKMTSDYMNRKNVNLEWYTFLTKDIIIDLRV